MQKFAGVLLKQGNEYLLQHRDDNPDISGPGLYQVWGGAAEPGENFSVAAVRELFEETGVRVQLRDLKLVVQYVAKSRSDEKSEVAVFQAVVDESVEVNCYEGQGIVRFTDLRDIPKSKLSESLEQTIAAM